MIPAFDQRGLLPPGLHDTSISEIRSTLGFTARRDGLVDGLERYIHVWDSSKSLDHLIIDGSFVTSKPEPCDIDMILVPHRRALFSSTFGDLAKALCYDRPFTKAEFGCEAFVVASSADLDAWLNFFKCDRQGNVRGLLQLRFPL